VKPKSEICTDKLLFIKQSILPVKPALAAMLSLEQLFVLHGTSLPRISFNLTDYPGRI
jgi:hypothetical protein